MTKLEFIDKINDILIGLNTAESDALGSLYDELMRDNSWQQVRIQASIAAMQGQLANHVLTENMIESVENVANFPKVVANASVRIADALVEELKKGGEQ